MAIRVVLKRVWLVPPLAAVLSFAAPADVPARTSGGGAREAQTLTYGYQVLHSFLRAPTNPAAGVIEASDGNFYGTTELGGAGNRGTVFRITPQGGFTILHTFSGAGTDGARPAGELLEGSDGNFYGTTKYGGPNDKGTVFRMTPGGAVTTIHSFTGSDGASPYAGVTQGSDGNLYGTTYNGGANSDGTVFKLTLSGTLTTLHSFAVGDGQSPAAGLVEGSDGNFYGTTFLGGDQFDGTVFRITPTGTLTTLYSFAGIDGANPRAGVVRGSDGTLYGVTEFDGGPVSRGTLFALAPSGTLTTLHRFTGVLNDGANPGTTLLQASDGSLYGTTVAGGSNDDGTVYKVGTAGTVTTLYSFTGAANPAGGEPDGSLVQGTDGNLYGTTFREGVSNGGAVYRITTSGALTVVHPFEMRTGKYPSSVLIQGSSGKLYGTTYNGGPSDNGTVFTIDATGTLTILHSFTGKTSDGANPQAGLVEGADGNFYGMTYYGGAADDGTVFEMDRGGNVTILHSFTGKPSDGANPEDDLIRGSDGNFYGTTAFGGANDKGTVFRMDATGNVSTLHSFSGVGTDGASPYGRLLQGSDGNLYGTTQIGGTDNYGTVFRITPGGVLSTIHSFAGIDGSHPLSGLIEGSDGRLYGTTEYGGANDAGTVFAVARTGVLTTLHTFDGSDGAVPIGSLVEAGAGDLYGTTSLGGDDGQGTVFELSVTGGLTTVHSFTGVDGANPFAGLLRASDGNLYGTTLFGGKSQIGVVFALVAGSPTAVGVGSFAVRRPGHRAPVRAGP